MAALGSLWKRTDVVKTNRLHPPIHLLNIPAKDVEAIINEHSALTLKKAGSYKSFRGVEAEHLHSCPIWNV